MASNSAIMLMDFINMKNTVSIIIENKNSEILLLLRDDKPTIPFPNQWYIPGGVVEEGELIEEAMCREMHEEFGLELSDLVIFKEYVWPDKHETVYYVCRDLVVEDIEVNEGQRIEYFDEEKIKNTKLAFHDNEIAVDFFEWNKKYGKNSSI